MPWFRRARQASASWNVAKTGVQIAVFWGVFLFVIPPRLVFAGLAVGIPAFPTTTGRVLGVLLFAAASGLGLVSAYTMAIRGQGTPLPLDAPRQLVAAGPYAWVRNPMAIAGLAQGTAVSLWHGSILVFAYVVAGGVLWHAVVRPLEEGDLERTFGQSFRHYRATVPLWRFKRPGTPSARAKSGGA